MSKRHFLLIFLITTAILLSLDLGVQAQSQSPAATAAGDQSVKNQKNRAEKNRRNERLTRVVSPERTEKLLAFVQKNHAEALPLLEELKENRQKKFARVIGNLDREVVGLDRLRQQSQKAYDNALKQWVNRSKINLLTAKLRTAVAKNESAKGQRDEMAQKIRSLLNENIDLRVQQLSFEIKSASRRKQRLEKTLVDLLQNRNSKVDGRIEAITKPNSRKNKESAN
jgi:hypothetical protein